MDSVRRVLALPLSLPTLSPGLAALSPAAREVGRRAAARAAGALAAELGCPVQVEGRALAAPAAPSPGLVRLGLLLEALPADALVEVEASLAATLADRLAGGDGPAIAALSLTPVEQSVLELLALVALAAAADGDPVATALAPRLSSAGEIRPGALAVDVAVAAGGARGRCRLHLPPEALLALRGRCDLPAAVGAWAMDGWVASGSVSLSREERASLARGDVVLLDEPPSARAEIRLPGLRLGGWEADGIFHLEVMSMTDAAAAIPLPLSVEVARVSLTLSELSRLEPGAAFPLHAPRDGRVVLRLGERAVARGQLVEIEGALGVRLESLEEGP